MGLGVTSEEFLGSAIKECAKRKGVVIATKFIPRTSEEIKQGQHIRNYLEASSKRLEEDSYIKDKYDYLKMMGYKLLIGQKKYL